MCVGDGLGSAEETHSWRFTCGQCRYLVSGSRQGPPGQTSCALSRDDPFESKHLQIHDESTNWSPTYRVEHSPLLANDAGQVCKALSSEKRLRFTPFGDSKLTEVKQWPRRNSFEVRARSSQTNFSVSLHHVRDYHQVPPSSKVVSCLTSRGQPIDLRCVPR